MMDRSKILHPILREIAEYKSLAEMNYQNISSFPFAQFSSLLTSINMSIDKMRDVTFSVNVFFS